MSRILMVTHGSGGDIIPFVRLAEIPGTKEMTKLRRQLGGMSKYVGRRNEYGGNCLCCAKPTHGR
jgi:hypothetical protein